MNCLFRCSYLVFLCLIFEGSNAKAQFFAELSYRLWNGDCPQRNSNTFSHKNPMSQVLPETTCLLKDQASTRLALMTESFGEIAESAYLASLAEIRSEQLDCTQTQISNLQKNPDDLNTFVNDFEAKLTLLGHEKRRMIELQKAIPNDKSALEQYEKSKLKAIALIESLPYKELAPVRQVISYVISQYETTTPDRLEPWLSKQTKQQIKKALTSSSEIIQSNQSVLKKGVMTFGASLDSVARESLAQDTELVENFRNSNDRIQNELKPVACQVDAKYGKGAQSRDQAILAVSILGSGAALGFAKLGMAGLSSSLTGAAAMGSISVRTAGVLRVLAAAGGTAASLSQTHKACFGQDVSVNAKRSDKKMFTCNGNILASQTAENCLLVSALNALGAFATTKTVQDALKQIKNGRADAASNIAVNLAKKSNSLESEKTRTSPQLEIWKLAESGATDQAVRLTREITEGLKSSKIISIERLGDSASNPYLVTLQNGTKGVWKKMDGPYTSGEAEIAAYKIDQKLGLNHVPITVEREVDGVKGSLQLFVDGTDNAVFENRPSYFTWFDTLLRNQDRTRKNYLTAQGRPIAIDHGVSFDHPDAWKIDLGFFKDVRNVLKPIEQQYNKVQVLEDRLEVASRKYGQNSAQYKSLMADLAPKLAAERKQQQEVLAIAQNNLSVMLPDRAVYQKLKTVSDQEWKSVLKDQLSNDQINSFLQRRNEVLNGIAQVEKVFGQNIFRDGPVAPLVRRRFEIKKVQAPIIDDEGTKTVTNPEVLNLDFKKVNELIKKFDKP